MDAIKAGWIVIKDKETLPPGEFQSPMIWLLLSDGQEVIGYIHHKSKSATYDGLYHGWCAYPTLYGGLYHVGCSCWKGADLVAWRPIETPSQYIKD